jgi:hypothetical protein
LRWLDPDSPEVPVNPLSRFVLREEKRITSEVGSISRAVIGTENAARSDLGDAPAVDIAAALPRQVRNDPRKAIWYFPFFLGLSWR